MSTGTGSGRSDQLLGWKKRKKEKKRRSNGKYRLPNQTENSDCAIASRLLNPIMFRMEKKRKKGKKRRSNGKYRLPNQTENFDCPIASRLLNPIMF